MDDPREGLLLTDEAVHALREGYTQQARMRTGSPWREGAEAFLRYHANEGRNEILEEVRSVMRRCHGMNSWDTADAIITAFCGEDTRDDMAPREEDGS